MEAAIQSNDSAISDIYALPEGQRMNTQGL